jgi:hypothetical protein
VQGALLLVKPMKPSAVMMMLLLQLTRMRQRQRRCWWRLQPLAVTCMQKVTSFMMKTALKFQMVKRMMTSLMRGLEQQQQQVEQQQQQ